MKFSKIKENDIANGIGVTVSVWTQGCPHHCKGCFNEETWSFSEGLEFTQKEIDNIFFLVTKNGVERNLSILGGEPLCEQNIDGVIELTKKFKEKFSDKVIYLWTGYTFEQFNDKQKKVLPYIDILVDGLFIEKEKNLKLMLRGSNNQRIIDVKETLNKNEIVEMTI